MNTNQDKILAIRMASLTRKIEECDGSEDEEYLLELEQEKKNLLTQYYKTLGDNIVPLIRE